MTAAIIFPGQGAQFVGMGQDWAQAFPVAHETFQEANEALGFSLSDAIWSEGSDVNRTDIAQPGILTTSVAIIRVLESEGHLDRSSVPLTAGLSLGEYSALWLAEAISLPDALRLVRLRGQAMQEAAEATPSGMLSLLGATEESANALAKQASSAGICQVANLNSPSQIILSGENAAMDAAEAAAKEHGIRRCMRLSVAGAFHSEVMRPAASRLEEVLAQVKIHNPKIPVISNVTAEPAGDPDGIRSLLARQVCAPVLWERSIRAALAQGQTEFLEPGPGKVLSGLMRKTSKDAQVRSIANPSDLST
jgi:[acyl-carrier-protein] S-malonyltransferase